MMKYIWEKSGSQNIIVEYIWIDDTDIRMRSKSRTINCGKGITSTKQIPDWTFDGSSTGQSGQADSEIVLKPVYFCKDPFRGQNHLLVLCETFQWNNGELVSADTNFRNKALEWWEGLDSEEIQFGIEQEYLIKIRGQCNRGDKKQDHYCATNSNMYKCRQIAEQHYIMCLDAGLNICGINSEVLFNQWEYQIGICNGFNVADQLWMSRYILTRVAEQFNAEINFNPKPYKDQNGSGAHINVSSKSTRLCKNQDQNKSLEEMMLRLSEKHHQFMPFYGLGNEKRLTGQNETSDYDQFTYGEGSRNCSVRMITHQNGGKRQFAGYIEDRRPASNMDPYVCCTLLASAVAENTDNKDYLMLELKEKYAKFIHKHIPA